MPGSVFVTGGSGFLGRALVGELLARGVTVRCLVRSEQAAIRLLESIDDQKARTRLELLPGSLRDERMDPEWLHGCDVAVHAAGAMRGAPSVLVRSNVAATRALCEAAVENRLRRFVLVSSMSVYDSRSLSTGAVLDESCPIETVPGRRSAYVYSKVVQEEVCRQTCATGSVPVVVVRPAVIFGPGRSCMSDRVGPRLGRLIAVVDSERRIPYTFVANCATAIAAAVMTSGVDGEAFNIVDDDLPTAQQIADLHRSEQADVRVVNVPRWAVTSLSRMHTWRYRRSEEPMRFVHSPENMRSLYKPLCYSNVKAKTHLNWFPRVTLGMAMRKMSTDRLVHGLSAEIAERAPKLALARRTPSF